MRVHLKAQYLDDEGDVFMHEYVDGQLALEFRSLDGEPLAILSINLVGHGLIAPSGHVFVKNYSEGEGLTEAMEEAGIATYVETVFFGPYDLSADLMKVNI